MNSNSGRPPSVFVSSTFYDLAQIRADLRSFIDSMGLDPVLSEYNNFPVDPDQSTIENCTRAVENRADIFLLVIGGRYGSLNDQGKSITNLEYLKAKSKGVPIYAFVNKSILNMLSLWRDNPNGNFESVVDSPKLFDFVESIGISGDRWVFPFETAQDIIEVLRNQLAYLLMDSLQIRALIKTTATSSSLDSLSGGALKLALEKPIMWEHRVLSQLIQDQLTASQDLKRDLTYGVAFGQGITLSSGDEIRNHVTEQFDELTQTSSGLERLFNEALPAALTEVEETQSPEPIIYLADRIGRAYRSAIEWSLNFRRIHVDEAHQNLLDSISIASRNMISEIEQFGQLLESELVEAVRRYESGESVNLRLTLTITAPDLDPLIDRLNRI